MSSHVIVVIWGARVWVPLQLDSYNWSHDNNAQAVQLDSYNWSNKTSFTYSTPSTQIPIWTTCALLSCETRMTIQEDSLRVKITFTENRCHWTMALLMGCPSKIQRSRLLWELLRRNGWIFMEHSTSGAIDLRSRYKLTVLKRTYLTQ